MKLIAKPPRLVEAAVEAALVLTLVLASTGWPALDAQLIVVLTGMLVMLTIAGYALHAVTFDCFLLTVPRAGRPDAATEVPRSLFVSEQAESSRLGAGPGRSP